MFLLSEHDREERAHQAGPARREKAMKQALTSLAVLYGAVGGVIGGVLPLLGGAPVSIWLRPVAFRMTSTPSPAWSARSNALFC